HQRAGHRRGDRGGPDLARARRQLHLFRRQHRYAAQRVRLARRAALRRCRRPCRWHLQPDRHRGGGRLQERRRARPQSAPAHLRDAVRRRRRLLRPALGRYDLRHGLCASEGSARRRGSAAVELRRLEVGRHDLLDHQRHSRRHLLAFACRRGRARRQPRQFVSQRAARADHAARHGVLFRRGRAGADHRLRHRHRDDRQQRDGDPADGGGAHRLSRLAPHLPRRHLSRALEGLSPRRSREPLNARLAASAQAAGDGLAASLYPGARAARGIAMVSWTAEADIVVVGSGATGIPSAIVAREAGCSVILIEAEADIGGHAIVSGGNVPLGGGTSAQKKYGIPDTPDLLFKDLTDWSVVEPNGFPDYRYNDREIIRAFADWSAPTFEFLLAHGVVFADKAPDQRGGGAVGNSVPREMHAVPVDWHLAQTGVPAGPEDRLTFSTGNGLMRPLEAAAREAGVKILLEHRMTALHREGSKSGGRVIGIAAAHRGERLDVRAKKAVILATGGSSGNVNFRRMFDPRLTEEYCGLAGMPWSDQDASGELAAMDVGASLWGLYNHVGEFGATITKPGRI